MAENGSPGEQDLTTLACLGITWALVGRVAHPALDFNQGNLNTASDFSGRVAIEYGFHRTLMLAAVFTALVFARALTVRTLAPQATAAPRPARASRTT